jgi:hypothetical protein
MSYLGSTRLHFFGQFIAEPSTINNIPQNFEGPIQNPGWNPNGDHQFAFTGASVTSVMKNGTLVTSGNPLIGTAVTTPGSPFAKLVDLDVDVQLASRIFGLQVAIADSAGNSVTGTMATASFRDFWGARLLGVYQSTLGDLTWKAASGSWLAALKAASPDVLSIRFIVDLYTGMSGGPHQGRLAGAIGPAAPGEPAHYVGGRRLVGGPNKPSALAELAGYTLTLDVGNVVGVGQNGDFAHPSLVVAVRTTEVEDVDVKSGAAPFRLAGLPTGWRQLGVVPTTLDRYKLTSGIESLTLSAADAALCASAQLGLFSPNGAVVAVEDDEGLFVFPDPQAFAMNPGDQASVALTARTFGKPAPSLQLEIDAMLNSGAPGLSFPGSVTTDTSGRASVSLQASDPGAPRGDAIDGQVFGFGGEWSARSGIVIPDAQSAVAVRVFSVFSPPASPKWSDIQPLFQQYHTMYLAMAAILDLTDLNAVVAGKAEIRRRLLLPIDDPGFMPVTRDLSAQKRAMIVAWIDAGCPV